MVVPGTAGQVATDRNAHSVFLVKRYCSILVATFLFASCGGSDGQAEPAPTIATPSTVMTTPIVDDPCQKAASEIPFGALTAKLELPPSVVAAEIPKWNIVLTNTTDADISMFSPSGRQADVIIIGPSGSLYQWSNGRSFTQGTACEVIPAGSTKTVVLEDDKPLGLAAGSYRIVTFFDTRPTPQSGDATVEIV